MQTRKNVDPPSPCNHASRSTSTKSFYMFVCSIPLDPTQPGGHGDNKLQSHENTNPCPYLKKEPFLKPHSCQRVKKISPFPPREKERKREERIREKSPYPHTQTNPLSLLPCLVTLGRIMFMCMLCTCAYSALLPSPPPTHVCGFWWLVSKTLASRTPLNDRK